jgi:hypothetical protein
MEFEAWLDSTSYNEGRKNELRIVEQRLAGHAPTRVQRRKIQSFIKAETYAEFKAPRWINSRSDYFKAYSGPAFKSIEKELYKFRPFVKHVEVSDRPALLTGLERSGARYIGTDFTAFESSFSADVMDAVECQLYRHMLSRADPRRAEVICRTITGVNSLTTRAGLRLDVTAGRMSGDMCTSLGNGFTNLMLWAFFCHENRIPDTAWAGYVEGDDGLFAVYDPHSTMPSAEQYASLGFTIKIEHVDRPGEASFCGMITAAGVNVKDPRQVLVDFGWTLTQPQCGARRAAELQRAKALSLQCEHPGCPILQALAQRALYETRGYLPYFVDDGYHSPPDERKAIERPVPDEARELVFHKFGIEVRAQLAIEAALTRGDWASVAALLPAPAQSVDMARYECYT